MMILLQLGLYLNDGTQQMLYGGPWGCSNYSLMLPSILNNYIATLPAGARSQGCPIISIQMALKLLVPRIPQTSF